MAAAEKTPVLLLFLHIADVQHHRHLQLGTSEHN